jgi:hypothetical protein
MTTDCGHGHVYPRPDGHKARCGGPGMCMRCAMDLMQKDQLERANAKPKPLWFPGISANDAISPTTMTPIDESKLPPDPEKEEEREFIKAMMAEFGGRNPDIEYGVALACIRDNTTPWKLWKKRAALEREPVDVEGIIHLARQRWQDQWSYTVEEVVARFPNGRARDE